MSEYLPDGIPDLVIRWVDGQLWISWSPDVPGFRLEQASGDSLPAWTPAPAGNPALIPGTGQALFFRLRRP